MSDWADERAIELGRELYKLLVLSRRNDAYDSHREAKFVGDIAPALAAALRREHAKGEAEGHRNENEKCAKIAINKDIGNGHMETCAWIADAIRARSRLCYRCGMYIEKCICSEFPSVAAPPEP